MFVVQTRPREDGLELMGVGAFLARFAVNVSGRARFMGAAFGASLLDALRSFEE